MRDALVIKPSGVWWNKSKPPRKAYTAEQGARLKFILGKLDLGPNSSGTNGDADQAWRNIEVYMENSWAKYQE